MPRQILEPAQLLGNDVHVTAEWRTFWLQNFLCGGAGDGPERILHNFWGAVQRTLVYSAPITFPSAMLHAHLSYQKLCNLRPPGNVMYMPWHSQQQALTIRHKTLAS